MGVYYKCNICGAEEKGVRPACGCDKRKTKIQLAYREGARILETFILDDCVFAFLYEKLENREGAIFHMRLCISGPDDEYECHEKIACVDEREYLIAKASVDGETVDFRLNSPLPDGDVSEDQPGDENGTRGDCEPLDPNTDLEELKGILDREMDEYAKERDRILKEKVVSHRGDRFNYGQCSSCGNDCVEMHYSIYEGKLLCNDCHV